MRAPKGKVAAAETAATAAKSKERDRAPIKEGATRPAASITCRGDRVLI